MDPSIPKLSLHQMLATIPPQNELMLNQKTSDKHLAEISRALVDWRSVSPYLGIDEPKEAAIEEEKRTADARRYVLILFFC